MTTLRVLQVIPSFAPAWRYGGPIESVYQLCRHLAEAGCEVRVLTTDADGLYSSLNVDTSREIEVATRLRVRYCRRWSRHSVAPALVGNLPSFAQWADVVHLHAVYSFPVLPTLLACRMLRKPLVWSPRGALQSWAGMRRARAKRMWNRVCSVLAPHDATLCATSDAERDDSRARLAGLRTEVIANGVMIPDSIAHERSRGVLRLAYLGRLDPKKGIENLLTACRILEDRRALYQLTIGGEGEEEYVATLRASVAWLGLGSRVAFLGQIERDRLAQFFARADVLVLPSHSENFGNVVPEALAHEVPVIASKATPWAALENIGCGLWVDNDAQSLAGAIARIATMDLRQMGRRGGSWVATEYSWTAIARCALALYTQLVQRRSALVDSNLRAPVGTAG